MVVGDVLRHDRHGLGNECLSGVAPVDDAGVNCDVGVGCDVGARRVEARRGGVNHDLGRDAKASYDGRARDGKAHDGRTARIRG